MHQPLRRRLPALIAFGIAAGTTVVTAPAAHADPDCGRAPVQYSLDGGAHWTNSPTMPSESGTVQVRLAGNPSAGCDYHVSLASYSTQGATWATSGTQTFLGWATVTLNRGDYRGTLDVGAHLPPCYGEIALYGDGEKYDGSDSDHPMPHYPDDPFSGLVISSWNGGTACAPKPSPSPTSPGASPSGPATPSAPPSPAPAAPAGPAGTSAPPSPASPAPAGPAHPSPGAGPVLAFTGSDGDRLAATAAIGAALLVAGAATTVVVRRQARRR
ncbi:hypothetical protein LN042_01260 [Kitasatospora sp. RB6PN24]|uniref:hypothetical protein n=1 Tax=Kitasatospora humi TaxID=2893891 RepID=UPI001E5F69DA|nr:hypothetical protein [Kitasatospora humi]MCC9305748.1 hypothetical protein [Kitasatospora humi]